jgi:hypothetical protein
MWGDLWNSRHNHEDFAGLFGRGRRSCLGCGWTTNKQRQEADFGFVDAFGGEERFQFFSAGGIGFLDLCDGLAGCSGFFGDGIVGDVVLGEVQESMLELSAKHFICCITTTP